MTILTLLTEPDPRLRAKSKPVSKIDETILTHIEDMKETLHHTQGYGLAAPQVNILKRIVVYDLDLLYPDEKHPDRFLCMINPKIVWKSQTSCAFDEGCLSVPELRVNVERDAHIRVSFLTPQGQNETLEAREIMAVCIQHEIDHLDGILMIDYLSPLRKDMATRKLVKLKRTQE